MDRKINKGTRLESNEGEVYMEIKERGEIEGSGCRGVDNRDRGKQGGTEKVEKGGKVRKGSIGKSKRKRRRGRTAH